MVMNSQISSKNLFPKTIYWTIVKLFLDNPHQFYYQSEIAGLTKHKNGAIQPVLKHLAKIGFILVKNERSRTYYRLNNQFPKLSLLDQILN
ncbi:MAG: hypothetical protein CEN91_289 [Candidatus Berkelbacteria bacterium Licking1014_85]|uniref:HTH arsR-type domain-containing protein n=1 Tax=Candidatus Berkelbacteria bacterium Licking1014_85 TaxID=2017148 RepID=A0A554LJV5_9BACT|nr:MAG: hypothetical protein CEN91_289 [Candidatus Berkelbacteria bacterium Licking1014_85]